MTQTDKESTQAVVLRALGRIAPEADLAGLDAAQDLREQPDIESIDFLNFLVGLYEESAVDVPEADYAKLRTLDRCVAYLTANRVV
jgi:acyl carrier protein